MAAIGGGQVIDLVLGAISILFAVAPKAEFYPGMIGTPKRATVPRWFGRGWFFIIGAWFIYSGIPK